MFVHELKRQKEKKSNDQQKWMGKSDISVMTADHSVIKVWKCHQRSTGYQLSTMAVWSAVIFVLDPRISIQRDAQSVTWKEMSRTQQT